MIKKVVVEWVFNVNKSDHILMIKKVMAEWVFIAKEKEASLMVENKEGFKVKEQH